jgi:hypothetical protein
MNLLHGIIQGSLIMLGLILLLVVGFFLVVS